MRIVCTLFATGLLASPYIEFIGGAALIFIAIKLVTDHSDGRVEDGGSHPTTFGQAVRTILVADFIMSIDNILSLAGVANTVPEGKWSLIICGLMISIPIVLFGAQIFLMIMLKVPALIYLGAGILGMTAAELMTEDKALGIYLAPTPSSSKSSSSLRSSASAMPSTAAANRNKPIEINKIYS